MWPYVWQLRQNSDSTLLILHSRVCRDIIEGIENLCNISFNKSHQHSDSTDARIDRVDIDVKLLVDFFIQRSPFPDTDAIISIATGITGDKDINCYDAFEQGKIKFAKNFEKCHGLHKSAEVFKNVNEDSNNIFQAGVTYILGLYGASAKIKDLNTLRYNSLVKATAKSTCVLVSSLPPTTDAAFEHLKRVYLQIQIWLGNDVDIDDWGWKHFNNNQHCLNKQIFY
ncbi:uncharacterized protein TNCV_740891 [Trichonephila clavipes]|nr:uncharacterized protein TNCV_740891 [Trichonephila clavipes]